MRSGIVALLVVIAAACSSNPTAGTTATATTTATTVFVAPTGSDRNDGTAAHPLRSPQIAIDRLPTRGGTVVLRSGIYRRQRIVLTHRRNVTVRPDPGAHPVLDGRGLTPPDGFSALVQIRDSSGITVAGLALTGYRTTSVDATPAGIYVSGAGHGIVLRGNHVHNLGNDNATRGDMDINAHGIAVYGTNANTAISAVTIENNEVDHLHLGASEAVVVNGNVDGWTIAGNDVHDDDNIGIDAIGYEETITGAARYTEANRARHGVIRGNTVTNIISRGNPAYWSPDGWCDCADGIYVDGGDSIAVSGNQVQRADIGIEVAAENPRGRTDAITVSANTVRHSRAGGISVGGYDPHRGAAHHVTITGNVLVDDDTLHGGTAELLVQHHVDTLTITGNTLTATDPDRPLLVQTTTPIDGLRLDRNRYVVPNDPADAAFVWSGRDLTGLGPWRRASGQDAHSTVTTA